MYTHRASFHEHGQGRVSGPREIDMSNQETWNECKAEYSEVAEQAKREVTPYHPSGTAKTREEYYEDLVWKYEGLIASGAIEGC